MDEQAETRAGTARSNRSLAYACLAAAAYLLVALFTFRSVLPAPSADLPFPALLHQQTSSHRDHALIDHWDQSMVLATVIRNANLLVTRPWDLLSDAGQCFPMPRAYTLGEHMFGLSFLAAVPYFLSGDPILTFNVALVLTIWIPGLTMYFLSLHFTRHPGAAFLAGLAFALVPGRIVDPGHPYVHGDLWAPAALLFLHRLFTTGRWRDALALSLFLSLEIAESLYPLIATAILVGVYGLHLLLRKRAELGQILPKLLVVLSLCLLTAWVVLGPYLETRDTWGLLEGRGSRLLQLHELGPGAYLFVGWVVAALALVALIDRLSGPRLVDGDDPRLAFLCGGLLVAWCIVGGIHVPFTNVYIPALFRLLYDVAPGLTAVRALPAVSQGIHLVASFLVGYGALVLLERLRPRASSLVVAGLSLALLASCFVAPIARSSYGRTLRLNVWRARPPDEDIALLKQLPPGPLVDLPLRYAREGARRLDVADHLLLGSFAPRPQAICYNSFQSPVNDQVLALASALPDPASADALAALGFRGLLVHEGHLPPGQRQRFFAGLPGSAERVKPLGKTARISAYQLGGGPSVSEDLSLLGANAADSGRIDVVEGSAEIPFAITNRADVTFRHPNPMQPSPLVARWRTQEGQPVRSDEIRGMLPIALGAGATARIPLTLRTPEERGTYIVTLERGDGSPEPVAIQTVHVTPLEETLTPSEKLLGKNQGFVQSSLLDPPAELSGPEATMQMRIAPEVAAASLAGRSDLVVRWIELATKSVHDTPLLSSVTVVPSDAEPMAEVTVHVPPVTGPAMIFLAPRSDPDSAVAFRMGTIRPPDNKDRATGDRRG